MDWGSQREFGEVYADKRGPLPLPKRQMPGLNILKLLQGLADEGQCDRWGTRTSSTYAAEGGSTGCGVQPVVADPLAAADGARTG